MKVASFLFSVVLALLIANPEITSAQIADTFLLKYAASKNDTILYNRVIRFDKSKNLYHVRDYFENGQIQMEAEYSSFDQNIKEGWQCNYYSNTKQGAYTEWNKNGQIRFSGKFRNGRVTGRCRWWYENGLLEADEGRRNGQLHGRVRYWSPQGELERDLQYNHGINLRPDRVTYPWLPYVPPEYESDSLKNWPLIIYLHGGSQRGTNLKKLYDMGIPDQIYRGRQFPFIIISPLCPLHLRWSTDEWFEDFFREITAKYRIDTTRVYLTGPSLGGNGTWYLAAKYPERFAAIAPISGFTSESSFIDENINNLSDIPIWAFHGRIDDVVPFEETERIVKKLEGINRNLRFTADPGAGHAISWAVYPGDELYQWFLEHRKSCPPK